MAKAKEIVGLDCGAEAAGGIRLALHARLAEMLAHREAALEPSDPQGVHDMRVASRRLRSALRDFKPYLYETKLAEVRGELKRLADALGRVRDCDVAAEELEGLSEEAPAEVRDGVEAFARGQRAGRGEAFGALAGEISEGACERLRTRFEAALEEALEEGRAAGRRPEGLDFRHAGREVVGARWEELLERGASLYRPHKTKRLHKARISAKRLRYALDLFSPCWGGALKDFAKEVARLQKSLGNLHDCDEWIASLGAQLLERESNAKRGADVQGAAAVWLLGHFDVRRAKHYRDALARWHEWEGDEFGACIKESLGA